MIARMLLVAVLAALIFVAFTPGEGLRPAASISGSLERRLGASPESTGEFTFLSPAAEPSSRPSVDSSLIRFPAGERTGARIQRVRVLFPAEYRIEAPQCKALPYVTMLRGAAMCRQWRASEYMTADREILSHLAAKLCQESRARSMEEELRAIVVFVQGLRYRNVKITEYELRSPCKVLFAGEGHCWEKACLAGALARNRGIPCALVYIMPEARGQGHAQFAYPSAEAGSVKLRLGSTFLRPVELCGAVAAPGEPMDRLGSTVLAGHVLKGAYVFCESVEPADVEREGRP